MPAGVWVLGFVSMFMDMSSELVHSLLPILLTSVLGASMVTVGLLEGIAEATAAITKVFSGALSDYLGKRKWLTGLGYGLAAITKPVFPLATTVSWIFGARFVDRIGKGIRGAPRDALIADITPAEVRGAAYGLRQALDSLGALLGPILAIAFMLWFANDIKAVLWIAVIPAFIAVLLLMVGVKEKKSEQREKRQNSRLNLADVGDLPIKFWLIVALGAVLTLARFSEAFLILRVEDLGLAIGYVPIIMVVMNLSYTLFAYPAGKAGDSLSSRTLLIYGLAVLIFADVLLAVAKSPYLAIVGAGFWGLHMALTQGLLSKLVANSAPAHLRGTAFGFFNLVSGLALLLASVIAGLLWSVFGASMTFFTGALFAAIAVAGLLIYK